MGQFHVARLLAATPLLEDPTFERTVVLLLDHDEDGALGVVLNRPSKVRVADVLGDWSAAVATPPVVFGGGPVEPTALVAIGRTTKEAARATDGWTPLFERLRLVDLEDDPALASQGLTAMRVFSGYAGWAPDQLETEIVQGAWFPLDAEPQDVFSDDPDELWRRVLARQSGALRMYATYPEDPTWN